MPRSRDAQNDAPRGVFWLKNVAQQRPRTSRRFAPARRSIDTDTALLSIRALGRLERPVLIPDIAAALRFELPELRAEAAHAMAAGVRPPGRAAPPASLRPTVFNALTMLVARLDAETASDVRGAICESIGLLPYVDADEAALGRDARSSTRRRTSRLGTAVERLGVAKGP